MCMCQCMHQDTHMHIYIYSHVYPCMCACTHVCMETCRSIENMMEMQTFIIYVGDDLIMHGLSQRMHSYIYIIMIADSRYYNSNILDAKNDCYIYIYINTNTHISFVLYTIRELAHTIIYAHP